MKYYIGVTDSNWYEYLSTINPDEVNFWKPSGGKFKAIESGDLFLFKSKYPENAIVGGGYFLKNIQLPMSLAWKAFGVKNGSRSYNEFIESIYRLRRSNHRREPDPIIGCNILVSPFFFNKKDQISAPSNWSPSIVQGKTYNTNEPIGRKLYDKVQNLLNVYNYADTNRVKEDDNTRHGRPLTMLPRLGQGSFRVIVTEAYNRRCAITGEKTLPVLEASHIKPYSENGPHSLDNGLLLRSDLHILYDRGYITITDKNRIVVSNRIKEDYGNGREYYKMHGKELLILPNNHNERPKKEYIQWHNSNVYLE